MCLLTTKQIYVILFRQFQFKTALPDPIYCNVQTVYFLHCNQSMNTIGQQWSTDELIPVLSSPTEKLCLLNSQQIVGMNNSLESTH